MPRAGRPEARQRAEPPLLDQACVAQAHDREIAGPLHSLRRSDIADDESVVHAQPESPGSMVDGAGAARDDDGATATATRSAAAGLRPSSPDAPAASLRDISAGDVRRDSVNDGAVENSHDDGDSSDAQVGALLAIPGRRDWGYYGSLFEPGDEILVERKLWRALQMPLEERWARRYGKPHSFVGNWEW